MALVVGCKLVSDQHRSFTDRRHFSHHRFAGKGDVRPGFLPGDVVLVLQVKDHAVFQRRGADLIMKKEISLFEALTGEAARQPA